LQAIEYNLSCLQKWAANAATEKAHVLAVAELFLCGYNIRPKDRENASVLQEEILAMVAPIAVENQIALVVPYAEKVEGSELMFDSMVFVDKDGTLLKNYRKCQLWGSDERTVWKYPYTENPDEVSLSLCFRSVTIPFSFFTDADDAFHCFFFQYNTGP
jgi:predicted amidohydrolase